MYLCIPPSKCLLTQIANEDAHFLTGNVLKPSVYKLISKVVNSSNGEEKKHEGENRGDLQCVAGRVDSSSESWSILQPLYI